MPRHILREGEDVSLAKVFKVSCKFETINWKTAGLSSSIEFVGELYQQNQRPSKHTQVLWVTALEALDRARRISNSSIKQFFLGKMPACISSCVHDNKLF